ncbi:MAG: antitoxin [Chloroflexota bacterium]
MKRVYIELAERIRGEITDLNDVVDKIGRMWSQVKRFPEDADPYLDSVALNLHSFYSGLERVFELVVRQIDQDLPSGAAWHHELLAKISAPKRYMRPSLVSSENALQLDAYRRFRHLVRNIYTTRLQSEKMSELVEGLPGFWAGLQAELAAFADFLDTVAESLN